MTNDAPRFYALDARLPAGVFGETHIITAFEGNELAGNVVTAEYVVLLTRGEPTRLYGRLRVQFGELGAALGSFTEDDVHAEACTQALLDLGDHLAKRANELGRPDLEFVQLCLRRVEARPLVGAWMRNKWHSDIRWLSSNAMSSKLASYCRLIKQNVPSFKPVALED